MTEIERATSLARPTLHRLANSLLSLGYIERDGRTRNVIEGKRLVGLALDVLRSDGPRSRRMEILSDLARETGESCHFAILSDGSVRLIDQIGPPVPLGVRYDGLDQLPAYNTACGKLLLALLPVSRRRALLADMAELSAAERRRLEFDLDRIAADRIGSEDGEHTPGVSALAVPVVADNGRTIGALGLASPTERLDAAERKNVLPLMHAAAVRLAAAIGGGTHD